MAEERLPKSLQESIATVVALVNDNNATLIASQVEGVQFDAPLDTIIARCLAYRREYKRPPGKSHIDDVFADILEDEEHKQFHIVDNLIRSMVRQSEDIDTAFVASRMIEFVQLKLFQSGISAAAVRWGKRGNDVFEDLESIFRQMLHVRRDNSKDYGFSLADPRALDFLNRSNDDYCQINIPELDENGCHPTVKELLLFLAARNKGKSQFLHHCGKYGLLKGWQVAHYTLENSDDMSSQRYFQTLFSGVKRAGNYHFAEFFNDEDEGNPVRMRQRTLKPEFILEDRDRTQKFLSVKVADWEEKLQNLRIRRFPTGKLSFSQLERDLDEMEIVHKFRPKMLLLDYPQMMKMSKKEKDYTALDELIIELRGLAVERDLALVCPQQGNRAAEQTNEVRGFHGGGSIGMLAVADNAITYSQTESEEAHGVARLHAQKVRNDRARFTVLITQHYASGQFCMDSRYMTKELREEAKRYVGAPPDEDDDDEPEGKTVKPRSRKIATT